MLYNLRLDHVLRYRALAWRGAAEPRPGRFPIVRRHGSPGRPQLAITAMADRVVVELEHDFSSGLMLNIVTDREVADLSPDRLAELDDLMAPADRDEIAALYRDPTSFAPGGEALLGLFVDRDGAPELRASASFDGKVPYLVLRLGRPTLEIVLDHSFVHPERERRLERLHAWAIESPADLDGEVAAEIERRFGAAMVEAARFRYSSI